jgi:DNA-binding transcriptional regulator YiaG
MSYRGPVPIPTLDESIRRITHLPSDIRLIREREDLGLTQLARSLGVSKVSVWNWQEGKTLPEEPVVLIGLLTWADRLRGSKA